jgi:hypothetical protein
MEFTDNQLSNIPHTLSEPRFTTYLQHCDNDRERALNLYQWNLEISATLLIPLHLFEIALRNAVVEALNDVHTVSWPWNNGFIRSLPSPARAYRPKKDLIDTARRLPTMGKVVAELKFAFWEKMFTSRHDEKIWNEHINIVFPHAPNQLSIIQLREQIYNDVSNIRKLRNRIAHHEPIFVRNLESEYDKIIQLIGWRDTQTLDWLNEFEKVTVFLASKPI